MEIPIARARALCPLAAHDARATLTVRLCRMDAAAARAACLRTALLFSEGHEFRCWERDEVEGYLEVNFPERPDVRHVPVGEIVGVFLAASRGERHPRHGEARAMLEAFRGTSWEEEGLLASLLHGLPPDARELLPFGLETDLEAIVSALDAALQA